MTFQTKTEYLAFRAQWKANYKELSAEIAQGKRDLSNAFRENNLSKAGNIQRELRSNRSLANRMMLTLTEAKELAQEQYRAGQAEQKAA
jgi:hypothetical protein